MKCRKETRIVPLARPVPVHLVNRTAWVDEKGVVHFRAAAQEPDKACGRKLQGDVQGNGQGNGQGNEM